MMNKIILGEYNNPDRQIKTLTRSSKHYPNYETSDESLSIDEYQDCVIVFDGMLENRQKEICPFFTSGRHERTDV